MKQLLSLLTLVLLFTSCVTTNIPSYSKYLLLDYSPLTSAGLFVSESNSVNFDYTPVGSVMFMSIGGGKVTYYSSGDKSGNFESVGFRDVVEQLKYELLRTGANGIINLKITFTPATQVSGGGYIISGMAIKK